MIRNKLLSWLNLARSESKFNMNRKGDERLLSLYWFIMFIIIAVAVVSGVVIFYGSPSDVREIEAEILADKVTDCFVSNGALKQGFFAENVDLEKECKLSFVDDYYDEVQYYVEMSAGENSISGGSSKWREYCDIAESRDNIPVCVRKEMVVSNGEGLVNVKVISLVMKWSQNGK